MRKETAWAACPPRARRLDVRVGAALPGFALQDGLLLDGESASAARLACSPCGAAAVLGAMAREAVAR